MTTKYKCNPALVLDQKQRLSGITGGAGITSADEAMISVQVFESYSYKRY